MIAESAEMGVCTLSVSCQFVVDVMQISFTDHIPQVIVLSIGNSAKQFHLGLKSMLDSD